MDIGERVMEKLQLSSDEVNSLFAAGPVGGFVGQEVAARLASRFDMNAAAPLGRQLLEARVLSAAEAAWFDDEDEDEDEEKENDGAA